MSSKEAVGLTIQDRSKVIDMARRRVTGRDAIRELREGIGLSQYQLSRLLGVNNSTICRWESEGVTGRNPPVTAVIVVALLAFEAAGYVLPGSMPVLAYLQMPINAPAPPPPSIPPLISKHHLGGKG